jgi:hypothetical protein
VAPKQVGVHVRVTSHQPVECSTNAILKPVMGTSEFAIIIEEKPASAISCTSNLAIKQSFKESCLIAGGLLLLLSFLAGLPILESTGLLHLSFLFGQGSLEDLHPGVAWLQRTFYIFVSIWSQQ